MTINQLQQLLMWCSILNMGLLIVSFFAILVFQPKIRRIHSNLFKIPEGKVSLAIYLLFGLWKLLTFTFFIFPWIALSLIQ